MQKHDVENLKFLLSLSSASLKDWYDQASTDDIEYATELLNSYEHELDALMAEEEDLYVHQPVATLQ
ncbi:MAG: hypothetical protein RLZZ196_693 [Bacteroidota bacterium]|jgi:hypothetical protein